MSVQTMVSQAWPDAYDMAWCFGPEVPWPLSLLPTCVSVGSQGSHAVWVTMHGHQELKAKHWAVSKLAVQMTASNRLAENTGWPSNKADMKLNLTGKPRRDNNKHKPNKDLCGLCATLVSRVGLACHEDSTLTVWKYALRGVLATK